MTALSISTPRRRITTFLAAFLTFLTVSMTSVVPAQAAIYNDDPSITFSGGSAAAYKALTYVGKASSVCDNGTCRGLCDHVAGFFYGYAHSGFTSANSHWQYLVDKGKARAGSKDVPKGALLFWNVGSYGHVAVYVGLGYVVTAWPDDYGRWNLRRVPAWKVSSTYGGYRGWGYPVFLGSKL